MSVQSISSPQSSLSSARMSLPGGIGCSGSGGLSARYSRTAFFSNDTSAGFGLCTLITVK